MSRPVTGGLAVQLSKWGGRIMLKRHLATGWYGSSTPVATGEGEWMKYVQMVTC
jgi:hypothetical protein